MEMSAEFYSSTSSDDQSSINSVIHVETALDTGESTDESSAPPTPKRQKQSLHHDVIRKPHQQHSLFQNGDDARAIGQTSLTAAAGMQRDDLDDDTSTDTDADEEALLRLEEEGQDSDSSTSSEETQIWVQQSSTPRPAPRPQVPPKPAYRNSSSDSFRSNNNPPARQSIVSQNGILGRVETALMPEENANGDSGISNESPGTQSSGERMLSPHHTTAHLAPFSPLRESPHSPQTHSTPIQQYLARTAHHRDSSQSHSSHSSSQAPTLQQQQQLQHHHQSQHHPQNQSHFSPSHSHIITLHPIPSPAPSPLPASCSPKAAEYRHEEDQLVMEAHCKESLFNILSGLYAIFLVVLGAILPIAEAFAPTLNKAVYEGFYIYLFVISILFLLYVYAFLLRTRTTSRYRRHHKPGVNEDALLRKSPTKCKVSMASEEHTGSFYLRLGAVGFGICAMIYEGLMFGELFERGVSSSCVHVSEVIRPIVQLTFTFVQLYFIFLNSKMCIHRYRVFARFGLMHMIASNICVWLRTVVTEIVREMILMYARSDGIVSNEQKNVTTTSTKSEVPPNNVQVVGFQPLYDHGLAYQQLPNGTAPDTAGEKIAGSVACSPAEILGGVVTSASPYLYPCTIQYSLIAAGILYIMWRHIGEPSSCHSPDGSTEREEVRTKKSRPGVDCTGANRGLFFGIFTLVGIIITRIVFFVLVNRPSFGHSAVLLVYISEVVLYMLTIIAVGVAMFRIRDMKFHRKRDHLLDGILLITSLTGVFIFSVFSMVAAQFSISYMDCSLVIATGLLVLVQSTAQTVFILNGLRRSSRTVYQESQKPGREYITFLLVCNIGMWGITTFEVLRYDANPLALQFYGSLPWNIVTHISLPLAIFYRFLSMVCLATVWRNAYKQIKIV